MMLFLTAWATFGLAVWVEMRLALRGTKLVKPGILELILLTLIGPIPFVIHYFEKK